MPLYMDVHPWRVESAPTASQRPTQKPTWPPRKKYGVDYKRYWVDEKAGKIFCLVEAPDAEANTVHREAHGLVADEIYEVQQGE